MEKICKHIFAAVLASCACLVMHGQSLSQSERLEKLRNLENPAVHSSGRFLGFDSLVIKTDTIREEGAPVEYVYRWKNLGDKPLTVKMVTTGCNCAVPSFSPVPVQPGDSAQIKVTYHPKGHPGNFSRKFSVFTELSGSQPAVVLQLKGYVQPAVLPTWNFPVAMGPLLLKRAEVSFAGDKLQTERILCLNAGDNPLTVTAMTDLLPGGVTLWCEPTVLLPGKQGDIVIRYSPSDKVAHVGQRNFPIILEGLELPASRRKIVVHIM